MVDQLKRPTEHAEIYWFSEQPYGHVTEDDLKKYDSGRLGFPNSYFDPEKASVLSTTSTTNNTSSPTRLASTE